MAQSTASQSYDSLLKKGFDLHRQARFTEALPVLERARQLRPQDYFANLLVGIDLLRTGKSAQALPRLKLAAKLRPTDEIAVEYLGEAQAHLGQFAAAELAYREAVERAKDDPGTLIEWASFALERFRALGEELRATQAGVEAQKRLAAGSAHAPKGCASTLAALETSESRLPATGTELSLSVCYAAEAGRAAELVAATAGGSAGLGRLRGDILLLLKTDGPAAEAEYRNALALTPGDPALLARLAEAQLESGNTQGARNSASAALAIDAHRSEAMRTLARLAMNERDYEAALPWLKQLRKEAPADRGVQADLGRALAQTDANVEAEPVLADLLRSGYPDEKGSLHAILARVLRRLGRGDEATRIEVRARQLSDAFQAREASKSAQDE